MRRTRGNRGLRLDFDRLAGLWVAAHARLAVRFHNAADPRDHELARPALGFPHGELEKLVKEENGGFFRCADFLGEGSPNLGLSHWLCSPLYIFFSLFFFSPTIQIGEAPRETTLILNEQ